MYGEEEGSSEGIQAKRPLRFLVPDYTMINLWVVYTAGGMSSDEKPQTHLQKLREDVKNISLPWRVLSTSDKKKLISDAMRKALVIGCSACSAARAATAL